MAQASESLSWRIHAGLIDGREDEITSVVSSFGDSVQLIRGHWRSLPAPPLVGAGGIALTTLQDARSLQGNWSAIPGLYFDQRKYDVSYWMSRIDYSVPVLNRRCLFVPAGQVSWIPMNFWGDGIPHSDGLVFVRPDSGLKVFPGLVLDCYKQKIRSWKDVAEALNKEAPMLSPETMVCISAGHVLEPLEWRFWIVDRKVVASSPYSWAEGVVPWQEPPAEALRTAQEMADYKWQPDIAYVVDVVQLAMGDKPFYLNEINAASTSGLYSVPLEPLLLSLREAAFREIAGDLSIED